MTEYDEYERNCKLIRDENQTILDAFESWILDKGLSKATSNKHRDNIGFYINEFLLYEEPVRASEGVDSADHCQGGTYQASAGDCKSAVGSGVA